MPYFIKTERFTNKTHQLLPEVKKKFLTEHKKWVKNLENSGENLSSGYLVNQKKEPGGGGYLILEASCYEKAKFLIEQAPMIKNNLVSWDLHEWIPVAGKLLK